jgi:hypothetical protein
MFLPPSIRLGYPMPDNNSAQNGAIASDERIRNVLRRHIQRAYDTREFHRATLADESGVGIHTIDQIVSRDAAKHRRIAAEDALNIAYTLGEAAVSALIGCIHYSASRNDGDEMAPAQIVAAMLPHVSTIATAAADGRFDHTETPAVQEAADQIIATVLPLSSAGNAA